MKFSPFNKVAKAERALVEARSLVKEIDAERAAHRTEEYNAATKQRTPLATRLRKELEVCFLERVEARLTRGEKVCGQRFARESCVVSLDDLSKIHDTSHSAAKFTVSKIHRGSKHRGLWVLFDGSSKPQYIAAYEFRGTTPRGTKPDYALDCGLIIEPSEAFAG